MNISEITISFDLFFIILQNNCAFFMSILFIIYFFLALAPHLATAEPVQNTVHVTSSADFTVSLIPDSIFSRINGVSYSEAGPTKRADLRFLNVLHYDFEGNIRHGQIICHKRIANALIDIFRELYQIKYPIHSIRLIDNYAGDDEASMSDNNSSCFNYRRTTGGSRISKHAYGLAIDINPLQNPYISTSANGTRIIAPKAAAPYADRTNLRPGMLSADDPCVKAFRRHGFSWGGNWRRNKDYQHFEYRLK